jgi:protein O-GlcNAc transferase
LVREDEVFVKVVRFWLPALLILSACPSTPIHPLAVRHSSLCSEYVQKGNLEQAEQNAKLSMEYSQHFAEPYNCLAIVRFRQGRPDDARQLWKQAITLNNDFAEAHNNLGTLMAENGDVNSGIDQFRQALEIDPGYVSARLNLGLWLHKKKDLKGAREQLVRCTELDPNAGDCWFALGVVAVEMGFPEEGETFFERQTNVAKNDPSGWYNLCTVRLRAQKCDKAADACLTALSLNPGYIEARQNLGESYRCLAIQDKALEKYYDQIRDKPDYAPPHCNLGVAFLERKLFEKAEHELLVCQKLDPKFCFAYYRLAKTYDEQHNTDATIASCHQMVDCVRDGKMEQEKKWCVERVRTLTIGP